MGRGDDVNPSRRTGYEIRPISTTAARQFINEHHRHNEAPPAVNVRFAIALFIGDEMVGVATASHPVARKLNDGRTLEINRTCLRDAIDNGNSRLYGSMCRAAKALGYLKVITYTLQDESGSSLKASGFSCVADVGRVPFTSPSRPRYLENLFGERKLSSGIPKWRWERELTGGDNGSSQGASTWEGATT